MKTESAADISNRNLHFLSYCLTFLIVRSKCMQINAIFDFHLGNLHVLYRWHEDEKNEGGEYSTVILKTFLKNMRSDPGAEALKAGSVVKICYKAQNHTVTVVKIGECSIYF